MKCKVFKIRLQNEIDELTLNEFLAVVELKQTFASMIAADVPFWSILVFYEDEKTSDESRRQNEIPAAAPRETFSFYEKKTPAAETDKTEKPPAELRVLSGEQEKVFGVLKKWRNERAALDGLPPYMIAHNDSLTQIAVSGVSTKEELLQIKGFGEKRAEKYGDEILEVLNALEN